MAGEKILRARHNRFDLSLSHSHLLYLRYVEFCLFLFVCLISFPHV